MHRLLLLLGWSVCLSTACFAQTGSDTIRVAPGLELIRISPNAWVHVSYMNEGTTPCNGMVLVNGSKAFLFDTAPYDSVTQALLNYLRDTLKLEVAGFIANDWHRDSMEGLDVVQAAGIPTYAHNMTRDIARSKGMPLAATGFRDSLTLFLGDKSIHCHYFGAAHTLDNIVVWIPSEKVLFANCMVKELAATDLGYTDDGDVRAYPKTLQHVQSAFPGARVVIPGHGACGGMELVEHTLTMARQKR